MLGGAALELEIAIRQYRRYVRGFLRLHRAGTVFGLSGYGIVPAAPAHEGPRDYRPQLFPALGPSLLCLRFGFQSGNDAVATPKLNYEFANKVLHMSDCFGIVRANQRRHSDKAIMPYKVRPVICHQ
jgi:hypothetical protein